jgi:hypothetical protein
VRPKHLVVLRPHRSSPIGQCNQLHLKSGLIGISKQRRG